MCVCETEINHAFGNYENLFNAQGLVVLPRARTRDVYKRQVSRVDPKKEFPSSWHFSGREFWQEFGFHVHGSLTFIVPLVRASYLTILYRNFNPVELYIQVYINLLLTQNTIIRFPRLSPRSRELARHSSSKTWIIESPLPSLRLQSPSDSMVFFLLKSRSILSLPISSSVIKSAARMGRW